MSVPHAPPGKIPVKIRDKNGIYRIHYVTPNHPAVPPQLKQSTTKSTTKTTKSTTKTKTKPSTTSTTAATTTTRARAPGEPEARGTAPVRVKGRIGGSAKFLRRFRPLRGARYSTWFKAMGSFGSVDVLRGADSPDVIAMLEEEIGDLPHSFYSNQSFYFGRVKWDMVVPLEGPDGLVADLGRLLHFGGEPIDFRKEYPDWGYTYQIVEDLGGIITIIYLEEQ